MADDSVIDIFDPNFNQFFAETTAQEWKDLYNAEVEAFQKYYEWASERIKYLESCSPEAFEFIMEQERISKIKSLRKGKSH